MRGNTVTQKSGAGRRVLAFFLGLLIGIIFVIGAFGAGVIFLLYAKLDNLFGMFGVSNRDEETGEYIYVNTDTDNGGVSNLMELINVLYSMSADIQNLTLGQIDDLIPATHGLVSQLVDVLSAYVEVTYDEMSQVRFADFGAYAQDLFLDSSPSLFLSTGDAEKNKVMDYVLNGVEAQYVTAPSGEKIPLFVDNYYLESDPEPTARAVSESGEGRFLRYEDGSALSASQEKYLVQESGNPDKYDIYFYCYEDAYYIAERDKDDVKAFYFTADEGASYDYLYNEEYADTTGNYYWDSEGQHYYERITWRSLIYGDSSSSINRVMLIDLVSEKDQSNEVIRELFGDITVGDLTSGNADLKNRIDGMEISLFMDVAADKAVTAYLGYGITKVRYDADADEWTAKYKLDDGTVVDCTLTVEDGNIVAVSYTDGGETVPVEGTKISRLSARMDGLLDDLTLGELIGISDDNDNIILNAIKDSTINNLDEAISALTLNELYASEIYKTTVYIDADNDGQADKDADGNKIIDNDKSREAKLRIAVSAADYALIPDSEKDDYIVFDAGYLYYIEVDGVKKFVNWDNRLVETGADGVERSNLGKLDSLPAGDEVYYTYGAPGSMWRLLLTEKNADGTVNESALALNDIAKLISNLSSRLTSSTLNELDAAGIIDFKDEDLLLPVGDGRTLGELELNEALETLIAILKFN